jgi:hypothetical protein
LSGHCVGGGSYRLRGDPCICDAIPRNPCCFSQIGGTQSALHPRTHRGDRDHQSDQHNARRISSIGRFSRAQRANASGDYVTTSDGAQRSIGLIQTHCSRRETSRSQTSIFINGNLAWRMGPALIRAVPSSYNCSMPTYEMCVQEVIAGNRGFCSPNPYYRGPEFVPPRAKRKRYYH